MQLGCGVLQLAIVVELASIVSAAAVANLTSDNTIGQCAVPTAVKCGSKRFYVMPMSSPDTDVFRSRSQ